MTEVVAAPIAEPLLRECVETLQQVADYRLPKAIEQRLLWLSENKERLSAGEHQELLALVEMADQRTVEKVRARVLLKRLAEAHPQLFAG